MDKKTGKVVQKTLVLFEKQGLESFEALEFQKRLEQAKKYETFDSFLKDVLLFLFKEKKGSGGIKSSKLFLGNGFENFIYKNKLKWILPFVSVENTRSGLVVQVKWTTEKNKELELKILTEENFFELVDEKKIEEYKLKKLFESEQIVLETMKEFKMVLIESLWVMNISQKFETFKYDLEKTMERYYVSRVKGENSKWKSIWKFLKNII